MIGLLTYASMSTKMAVMSGTFCLATGHQKPVLINCFTMVYPTCLTRQEPILKNRDCYPFGAPGFTPVFIWIRVPQSLIYLYSNMVCLFVLSLFGLCIRYAQPAVQSIRKVVSHSGLSIHQCIISIYWTLGINHKCCIFLISNFNYISVGKVRCIGTTVPEKQAIYSPSLNNTMVTSSTARATRSMEIKLTAFVVIGTDWMGRC
jgi:hypothetical protein